MRTQPAFRLEFITVVLLLVVLAWDASGLDLAAAEVFGGPAGFPLRNHWVFDAMLHAGGRVVSWAFGLWVVASIWWPTGWLRRIDKSERIQLVVSTAVAVVLVGVLKKYSTTSCPSELAEFGGAARYVSHWAWSPGGDGGGGRCFPAGHASAAF